MVIKCFKKMNIFKKFELEEILKLINYLNIIFLASRLPASELFPLEEMK
ncbi:hypothetical protein [Terrisporobacter sp.]